MTLTWENLCKSRSKAKGRRGEYFWSRRKCGDKNIATFVSHAKGVCNIKATSALISPARNKDFRSIFPLSRIENKQKRRRSEFSCQQILPICTIASFSNGLLMQFVIQLEIFWVKRWDGRNQEQTWKFLRDCGFERKCRKSGNAAGEKKTRSMKYAALQLNFQLLSIQSWWGHSLIADNCWCWRGRARFTRFPMLVNELSGC